MKSSVILRGILRDFSSGPVAIFFLQAPPRRRSNRLRPLAALLPALTFDEKDESDVMRAIRDMALGEQEYVPMGLPTTAAQEKGITKMKALRERAGDTILDKPCRKKEHTTSSPHRSSLVE